MWVGHTTNSDLHWSKGGEDSLYCVQKYLATAPQPFFWNKYTENIIKSNNTWSWKCRKIEFVKFQWKIDKIFNCQINKIGFSSTCKELGSHHFILTTSEKLNTTKNQIFLDSYESWGHRALPLQLETDGSRDPGSLECGSWNRWGTWTRIGELLEAQRG